MSLPFVPPWKKAPFIRFTSFFIAGILLQDQCVLSFNAMLLTLAFLFTVLLVSFVSAVNLYFKFRTLFGICISGIFLLIGCLCFQIRQYGPDPAIESSAALLLTTNEPPVEKPASWKVECSLKSLIVNDSTRRVSGNLIVYFRKDSSFRPPQLHQSLLTNKLPVNIIASGNPGAFNYPKFLELQNIKQQLWLSSDQYRLLPVVNERSVMQFIYLLRDHVIAILKKFITNERDAGLAEALLIGYRYDLDRDLVQAYTNAGVVHIIAISGLHLGLIYWILLKLMTPLRRKKFGSLLSALVVVSGLWIFTLLAGAQPSVLRSAIMFSCIAIGECLKRRSSIYNSLAFSASLLLFINPNWLWDLGFQLSYGAVLSILLFNKRIYDLWHIRNKYLDFIWKSIAVTLSAQVLTTPICLYQFHQFPVYFLITNLVTVPLSSGILLLELLLCLASFIPAIAIIVGKITGFLIYLMNRFIEEVNQFPWASVDHVQITPLQALLLIITALLFMEWLIIKKVWLVYSSLICLMLIALLRLQSFYLSSRQQKIIVYNIPHHSAIDVVQGNESSFQCDSSLLTEPATLAFAVNGSRIMHRIHKIHQEIHSSQIEIQRYGAWVIARVKSLPKKAFPTNKLEVDLLILSGTKYMSVGSCLSFFKPKKIILDNNVPAYRVKKMKHELDSLRLFNHDLATQGAFVMNLN